MMLLEKLPKGAALLMTISGFSIVFAYAREAVTAYYFGASAGLDAFLVALTVPQLFATQAGVVTVSVLLPAYVRLDRTVDNHAATNLVVKWSKKIFLLFVVIGAVCIYRPEWIIRLVGPGLTGSVKSDAIHWLRLLVPYMILLGILAPLRAILEAKKAFFVPYLTGIVISACILIATAGFVERIGIAVLALGYGSGAFIAMALHMVRTQQLLPNLFHRDDSSTFTDIPLPIKSAIAMIIVAVAGQLGAVVSRAVASTLEEGSVSAFNYANVIVGMPSTIIVAAIGAAVFPKFSELIADCKFGDAFFEAKRWMLVLGAVMSLTAVIMISYRTEIVSLLFGYGKLAAEGIILIGSVLAILPIVLIFRSISNILDRLILAVTGAKWLAVISTTAMFARVVLIWLLVKKIGLPGLALAEVCVAFGATICRYFTAKFLIQKSSYQYG